MSDNRTAVLQRLPRAAFAGFIAITVNTAILKTAPLLSIKADKHRLSTMRTVDKKEPLFRLNFDHQSKQIMKNIRKIIGQGLTFNSIRIKATLFKFLITLVTLAAAALPWVLLIGRLTINGVD